MSGFAKSKHEPAKLLTVAKQLGPMLSHAHRAAVLRMGAVNTQASVERRRGVFAHDKHTHAQTLGAVEEALETDHTYSPCRNRQEPGSRRNRTVQAERLANLSNLTEASARR